MGLPGLLTALLLAQERPFETVLPELQYGPHCSSEITIHNTSHRFVDAEVTGHRASGALTALAGRPTALIALAPGDTAKLKLDIDDGTGWARIVERVPSPKLQPVLAISGQTQCLEGTELISEPRQIAPVSNNPSFTTTAPGDAIAGEVLLLINNSVSDMTWRACYSGGHTVSDGNGAMVLLCDTSAERTLGPYQSWRLPTVAEGKPLLRFRAEGRSVAMQLLVPSAASKSKTLFRVESTIRFGEPGER